MLDKNISFCYNQLISQRNLLEILRKVGIEKSDTICVHSDLVKLGKPATNSKNEFLERIMESLIESVGSTGTIIMPTFTYSFCKGEVYDVEKTPSTVGILTEYFRKMQQVKRTKDAIFSHAVYGKDQEYYLDIGNDCFGKKSIYEKMHQKNAKLVLLGTRTKEFTFFHYIEQSIGVPYRFTKRFKGEIREKTTVSDSYFDYYVRYLDKPSIIDSDKIAAFLSQKGSFREEKLGYGEIVSVELDLFYSNVIKKMKENKESFIKKEK